MGLTVKKVEKLIRAGTPGKHTDGEVRGLMLCIEGKTSAHWLLRFQLNHVTRHMGLGSARTFTLAEARSRATEARKKLADKVDPLAIKQAERAEQASRDAKQITFKEAARRCFEAKRSEWSNDRHSAEFLSSLERWVFPLIGNTDVAAVDRDAVLRCLEQEPAKLKGKSFWLARTTTADRTRNRVEAVLTWAQARGYRPEGTNPASWQFLSALLPSPRKVAPVKHMAAVPYDQVPEVMAALAKDETVAAQALRFIILTCARMSEAVDATWDEIDLKNAVWTISENRMKGRKPHRVPLSEATVELLKALLVEDGNPLVFISPKKAGVTISHTMVTDTLRRIKRHETVHGFRSSFSTWAAERTNFPGLVAEMALAHTIPSAVEKAYKRTDLFDRRRKLMEAWAKHCTTPAAAKGSVVPLRKRV